MEQEYEILDPKDLQIGMDVAVTEVFEEMMPDLYQIAGVHLIFEHLEYPLAIFYVPRAATRIIIDVRTVGLKHLSKEFVDMITVPMDGGDTVQ